MNIEIKPIPEIDFLQLCNLYSIMSRQLSIPQPNSISIHTLTNDLYTRRDFIAMGVYKKGELKGFTCGYAISSTIFYFSGIYLKTNKKYLKELIETSFKTIKDKGYSKWEADANNANMSSILAKYKSVPLFTKYQGEL